MNNLVCFVLVYGNSEMNYWSLGKSWKNQQLSSCYFPYWHRRTFIEYIACISKFSGNKNLFAKLWAIIKQTVVQQILKQFHQNFELWKIFQNTSEIAIDKDFHKMQKTSKKNEMKWKVRKRKPQTKQSLD